MSLVDEPRIVPLDVLLKTNHTPTVPIYPILCAQTNSPRPTETEKPFSRKHILAKLVEIAAVINGN